MTPLDAKYYNVWLRLKDRDTSFEMCQWEYYRDFMIVKQGNDRHFFHMSDIIMFKSQLWNTVASNTTGGSTNSKMIS